VGRPRKASNCHLSPANGVTRVIGYVRVSTDGQAESGAGLEAQRNAILAEVARRGWTLTEIIEDAGISAKTLDRPGIKKALSTLAEGSADVLLAAKLDRLSRSAEDFCHMLNQSRYYGWKLVILDCNVDTSTPAGQMLAGVMAQFAEFERQMIGVRTREALAVKKTQGIVGGRRANVPEDVITDLRAMRSQGMSYAAISDQLNANHVPTAQGGKQWHPATVQRVLDRVAA
jgi:DNA invertase Pin-like site-specific DNA recombinase